MTTPTRLRIDFVSDVACPWCAIGLASLTQALASLDGQVAADIHLQPFELNPDLPFAGEDAGEHPMHKYRIDATRLAANRTAIRERAAPLGVAINTTDGSRVWNTFDAHRLLHWAGQRDQARAVALKQALFRAYFTDNENIADHDVLTRIATRAGFDTEAVHGLLDSDAGATEVRAAEQRWQAAGIHSVPATIVNGQYLIAGGQPPETFANTLREIAMHGDPAEKHS